MYYLFIYNNNIIRNYAYNIEKMISLFSKKPSSSIQEITTIFGKYLYYMYKYIRMAWASFHEKVMGRPKSM